MLFTNFSFRFTDGEIKHTFTDGEIKLKYLCYSEFHALKQSSDILHLFYLKRNTQNTSIWNTIIQVQNLILFNYVFLTLFKITLFKCLHFLINSYFLFKQFSSLIELIIQSFFVKQRLHLVELAFPLTLSIIENYHASVFRCILLIPYCFDILSDLILFYGPVTL